MPRSAGQFGTPVLRPNLPALALTELPAGSRPTDENAFWIEAVKMPAFKQGTVNGDSATIKIGMIDPAVILIMARKFGAYGSASSNDRCAPMELFNHHQGKTGVVVTAQKFNRELPVRVTLRASEWVQLRASPESPIVLVQFRGVSSLDSSGAASGERPVAVYHVTCDLPGAYQWLSAIPLK